MKDKKIDLMWGGRNAGKTYEMQTDFISKWHLSTEGYYFQYRPDKNDPSIIRATLYTTKDNSQVDDIRVSGYPEFNMPHKTHHMVINHFEVLVSLDT